MENEGASCVFDEELLISPKYLEKDKTSQDHSKDFKLHISKDSQSEC